MVTQLLRPSTRALLPLFLLVHGGFAHAQGYPGGVRDALGDQFDAAPTAIAPPVLGSKRVPKSATERLLFGNEIAINASGIDHTPVAPGELRTFGEQLGPTRATRAMAIVHIAMFDAVNAILGGFQSYTGLARVPGVSVDAAIAQAARDTLVALYPSQTASIDSVLNHHTPNT